MRKIVIARMRTMLIVTVDPIIIRNNDVIDIDI